MLQVIFFAILFGISMILIPENKVLGCVSEVFVNATFKEGKLYWEGYSDALITKGLLAFLINGLDELTPKEVISKCKN